MSAGPSLEWDDSSSLLVLVFPECFSNSHTLLFQQRFLLFKTTKPTPTTSLLGCPELSCPHPWNIILKQLLAAVRKSHGMRENVRWALCILWHFSYSWSKPPMDLSQARSSPYWPDREENKQEEEKENERGCCLLLPLQKESHLGSANHIWGNNSLQPLLGTPHYFPYHPNRLCARIPLVKVTLLALNQDSVSPPHTKCQTATMCSRNLFEKFYFWFRIKGLHFSWRPAVGWLQCQKHRLLSALLCLLMPLLILWLRTKRKSHWGLVWLPVGQDPGICSPQECLANQQATEFSKTQ